MKLHYVFISILFITGFFVAAFAVGDGFEELSILGRGAGKSGDFGTAAIFGNPAAIARPPKIGAIAMYDNFWGMSKYGAIGAGAVYDFRFASAALLFQYFGSADIYSEMLVGATVAKSFPRIIDIGLRARFMQVGFPEPYGKASTIFLDAGLQYNFANRAAIGFFWQNPLQLSKLVGFETNEYINFGLRYDAASWATVFADVQFPHDAPGELFLGQEIKIVRWLIISGGIGGRPTRLYFGANFLWRDFDASWAGTIHPEMGMCNGGKIMWQSR